MTKTLHSIETGQVHRILEVRKNTVRRGNVKPRGNGLLAPVFLLVLCCFGCTQQEWGVRQQTPSAGNQAAQGNTDSAASRVVKLGGVLKDNDGKRLAGVVGVLFAIYEQRVGGSPLWQEVQNVDVDNQGRFTALVGTTKSEGIPPELFTTEKTRWLGKQVLLPGETEQPRSKLMSTPEGLLAERDTRFVLPLSPANSTQGQKSADGRDATLSGDAASSNTALSPDQGQSTRHSPQVNRRFQP